MGQIESLNPLIADFFNDIDPLKTFCSERIENDLARKKKEPQPRERLGLSWPHGTDLTTSSVKAQLL